MPQICSLELACLPQRAPVESGLGLCLLIQIAASEPKTERAQVRSLFLSGCLTLTRLYGPFVLRAELGKNAAAATVVGSWYSEVALKRHFTQPWCVVSTGLWSRIISAAEKKLFLTFEDSVYL